MTDATSARSRILAVGGLALAGAVVLTGCEYAQGGGWIGTSEKSAKITFGFDLTCDGGTGSGTLSYIDRSKSPVVSIELTGTACTDGTSFTGTYRPRPKGTPGIASVQFIDTGAKGPSKGDHISVTLTGGTFGGYTYSGALSGGNVTISSDSPTSTTTTSTTPPP